MYSSILATVNEHLNSEISSRYALNLARVCNARLYLVFIAEKSMISETVSLAERAIHRLFNLALKSGIEVEAITETGDILDEVKRIVKREKIDIVFTSTRREDVEKRFYTGTISRRLLTGLSCSVALVRVVHTGRIHPDKILIPVKSKIDHIEERAFFISAMSRAFNSKLYIFHAKEPVIKFLHGEVHLDHRDIEMRLTDDIMRFIRTLREYDVDFEERLITGFPSKSIIFEAFSKRHDLIVMGATERFLLSSVFKGNPVEELMRETPCDLIILKPRHED